MPRAGYLPAIARPRRPDAHVPGNNRARNRLPRVSRSDRREVELKRLAATFASLSLIASTSAQADQTRAAPGSPTLEQVQTVAPALVKYARGPVADLWKSPGLAPRDRQHRHARGARRPQP